MNIIKHKNWYFALSLIVIIPGTIALLLWGLRLSIDFTGGSRITYLAKTATPVNMQQIQSVEKESNITFGSIATSPTQISIKTKPLTNDQHTALTKAFTDKLPGYVEESYETVGPVVGQETTWNAIKGVGLASILIILFIAFSFRSVPKPANSWRFGICAIIALLHDVLVVVGIFAILGHFFDVEVDSLFVTALLTVIGFSVHDTIVVFDRIRENLKKSLLRPFDEVVNDAILQTLNRSLNTSFTVILVLLAILLFGGESIRWFVAALLIGVISGTYSSIFNASPMLVLWQELSKKK